jgi:hypothetical protein
VVVKSEIERAERRRFRIQTELCSRRFSRRRPRIQCRAFNSRPFDSGSDLQLKFKGVLT